MNTDTHGSKRAGLIVGLSLMMVIWATAQPGQRQRPQGGAPGQAAGEEGAGPRDPLSPPTFAALRMRSIGPAVTGGRIVALAVHPQNRAHYFAGVASGGVWKTTNGGITFAPVFDRYGAYSIGAITLDPKNPAVVWVGTGENNSQRSVAYGDGIYRSEDGGASFRNMGLRNSEHIARILIDPRDNKTVYVASQGPLWSAGGDRGLFKTTDAGRTWKNVLPISENTGVTDVVMDPRNPDVLIAAAWQRRRHTWTLINGGPESGLHKSTDGGTTWTRLTSGVPAGDVGRIGLAISPVDPNVIYATIEAGDRRSGIFRSADSGATWERRNDYVAQGMYYGKIFADPKNVDRIYIMDVQIRVSDDGGRTLAPLGERSKHVDNHVIWVDPADTDYYMVGCDGGLYESFDRGRNWHFKSNMPIGQYYDVTADNSFPFYNVYGGLQDNNTWGGPARTRSVHGITNSDWFVAAGGDGFHVRVDPEDPNIVYAESQYGGLQRFDRRSGQGVSIKPIEKKGEPALRFFWDSPLIISPHSRTRLYFAANRLFRSDDRGDNWRAISGDLSRQIDRDSLPVMGRLWSPEAVAKHQSTSPYGNITALSESPKRENLIYAGTDDGLIQVTENAGGSWRKVETFPDVPERSFVARVLASQHDAGTVYAAFENHKNGDFKPYLLKSTDTGKTWTSIKGNLPERGEVLAIAEDHVNPNLLFAGTEFGLYFTIDGGAKWIKLTGGLPTISVRDLAIQKRANDLIVGTFGRGIYILDDYSPLRAVKAETLAADAHLFQPHDALIYLQTRQYGGGQKASLGESFYTADNPPFGVTITYHLKEALRSKRDVRREAEREATRNKTNAPYPKPEQLTAEAEEEAPALLFTISDAAGKTIRTLTAGAGGRGLQRLTWDLRHPAPVLPAAGPPAGGGGGGGGGGFGGAPTGALVAPGAYKVSMSKRVDGKVTQIAGPVSFNVVADGPAQMPAADRQALTDFQEKAGALQRALTGTTGTLTALRTRIEALRRAFDETPAATSKMREDIRGVDRRLNEIQRTLSGDRTLAQLQYNEPPSLSQRAGTLIGAARSLTTRPTKTHLERYDDVTAELAAQIAALRKLDEETKALEKAADAVGAPWTPGRIPELKR